MLGLLGSCLEANNRSYPRPEARDIGGFRPKSQNPIFVFVFVLYFFDLPFFPGADQWAAQGGPRSEPAGSAGCLARLHLRLEARLGAADRSGAGQISGRLRHAAGSDRGPPWAAHARSLEPIVTFGKRFCFVLW